MAVTAEATDDPSLALDTCRDFLESRPVEHNIALTIVHERVAHPHEGRYWWTVEADRVSGYAWQSPVAFSAGLTPMSVPAVIALATRVSLDAPGLPGVIAEAGTAAAFAGRWTELRGTGAEPAEGQRIYRLDAVTEVPLPAGAVRAATMDDFDLWSGGPKRSTTRPGPVVARPTWTGRSGDASATDGCGCGMTVVWWRRPWSPRWWRARRGSASFTPTPIIAVGATPTGST
jgi:hypothetical protein